MSENEGMYGFSQRTTKYCRARKRTNQMVDYQEGRPNNCPISVSFQAQVKMGPVKTNDSRYSSKNL